MPKSVDKVFISSTDGDALAHLTGAIEINIGYTSAVVKCLISNAGQSIPNSNMCELGTICKCSLPDSSDAVRNYDRTEHFCVPKNALAYCEDSFLQNYIQIIRGGTIPWSIIYAHFTGTLGHPYRFNGSTSFESIRRIKCTTREDHRFQTSTVIKRSPAKIEIAVLDGDRFQACTILKSPIARIHHALRDRYRNETCTILKSISQYFSHPVRYHD